jgi:photosynthetic reaction center H subunit
MGSGALTHYFDAAQLVLWTFWLFFAGLVAYLVRENHREGYPMDSDRGIITGFPPKPPQKLFKLENGLEYSVPKPEQLPPTLNARQTSGLSGAPIEPVGNPLLAGVGPGAWAERADIPDLDFHGNPKVIPLRSVPEFGVSEKGLDPRGFEVFGADGEVAGVVRDLWVDNSDMLFRYIEVTLPGGGRNVLLPMPFARIKRNGVKVESIHAHQFADVPATKDPDIITFLEEDKIQAYFGAGTLYADEGRSGPLL